MPLEIVVKSNCAIFYPPYISIFALLVLLYLIFYKLPKSLGVIISAFLIVTGTTSNFIERVITGCVKDYLDFFGLFSFNIFDLSVVLGVILLLYELWHKKTLK